MSFLHILRVPVPTEELQLAEGHVSPQLAQRVLDLEQQVQRLEADLARMGGTSRGGPSQFWYIVTFAGWMMVPLIVVCMYHYKKNM